MQKSIPFYCTIWIWGFDIKSQHTNHFPKMAGNYSPFFSFCATAGLQLCLVALNFVLVSAHSIINVCLPASRYLSSDKKDDASGEFTSGICVTFQNSQHGFLSAVVELQYCREVGYTETQWSLRWATLPQSQRAKSSTSFTCSAATLEDKRVAKLSFRGVHLHLLLTRDLADAFA